MYIAAMARAGHALLIDCRSNASQAAPMPDPQEIAVLIVDTQVQHSLASGEYANRRAACESAARQLGVRSLRDATVDMLNQAQLSPELRQRALHVITENHRTLQASRALTSGGLERFGELMFASHDSLRDLFEVSCRELDVLVEAAAELRSNGVLGARMTGGGFGGCIVALVRSRALDAVQEQLAKAFEREFGRPCPMFTTGAAGGAQALQLDRFGANPPTG
jgi:galactokinase